MAKTAPKSPRAGSGANPAAAPAPAPIAPMFEEPAVDEISDLELQAKNCDESGDAARSLYLREKSLLLRQEHNLLEGAGCIALCETLAIQYNSMAMAALKHEDSGKAITLLKKAEVLTASEALFHQSPNRFKLRAVTYNNFGCVYKVCNRLHTALRYLDKAVRIEAAHPECENPAGTHLNYCAILSQMNKHQGAMEHAQLALEILEAEQAGHGLTASASKLTRSKSGSTETEPTAASSSKEEEPSKGDSEPSATGRTSVAPPSSAEDRKTSMLAIAYYNLGVENEYLGNLDGATQAYKKAYEAAVKELGENDPMTLGILNASKTVKPVSGKSAQARATRGRK